MSTKLLNPGDLGRVMGDHMLCGVSALEVESKKAGACSFKSVCFVHFPEHSSRTLPLCHL